MTPEAIKYLKLAFKDPKPSYINVVAFGEQVKGNIGVTYRESEREWEASHPHYFSIHRTEKKAIEKAIKYTDEYLNEIIAGLMSSGLPPEEFIRRIQFYIVKAVMEE